MVLLIVKRKSCTDDCFLKIQNLSQSNNIYFYFFTLIFFWFPTGSMKSTFKISSISFISDFFDSVMSADQFTLRLVLSAYAQLVLTLGWRKIVFFNRELNFCFEIHLVELTVNRISILTRCSGLKLRYRLSMKKAVRCLKCSQWMKKQKMCQLINAWIAVRLIKIAS